MLGVLGLILNFIGGSIYAVEPKNMALNEKIGQMLCLDFTFWNEEPLEQPEECAIVETNSNILQKPVTEINDDIKEIIANYHIGSVILFSPNFESKNQVKQLIEDLQKSAIESSNTPLLVCVDQEGGRVERFNFGRERFKNNGEIKTAEEALEKGNQIGAELKELGINCNFAPVVDVNSNPENPVINVRSFGSDVDIVYEFGKKFSEGLHSQGIISTAKHFPGHGDTSVDSHVGLPKVDKNLEELEKLELKPFQEMINSGVDMVMTAHIQFPKIEDETCISEKDGKKIFIPATLSKTILTDLLRKKMGFQGVIVTDRMTMKAISDNFGAKKATKMAIQAGADMICIPVALRNKSDIKKLNSLIKTLKNAVNNGEISENKLNESVERIFNLKEKYCK